MLYNTITSDKKAGIHKTQDGKPGKTQDGKPNSIYGPSVQLSVPVLVPVSSLRNDSSGPSPSLARSLPPSPCMTCRYAVLLLCKNKMMRWCEQIFIAEGNCGAWGETVVVVAAGRHKADDCDGGRSETQRGSTETRARTGGRCSCGRR